MRAVNRKELNAYKNSNNHWEILERELNRWRDSSPVVSERADLSPVSRPKGENGKPQDVASLVAGLAQAEAKLSCLAAQVEDLRIDRDHWRSMALTLSTAQVNVDPQKA